MPNDYKKRAEVISGIEEITKGEGLKYELSQDPNDIEYETSSCDDVFSKIVKMHVLRRIVALRDIVDSEGNVFVHKGDKGGYVESMNNLSQEGTCWIADDAWVYMDGLVTDDAWISDSARVFNNAHIGDKARVRGGSNIFDYAMIFGNADVFNSLVHDCARVYGNAKVIDSEILGNAEVFGNATVSKRSEIFHFAKVYGKAILKSSTVKYGAHVSDNVTTIDSEIQSSVSGNVAIFNQIVYRPIGEETSSLNDVSSPTGDGE